MISPLIFLVLFVAALTFAAPFHEPQNFSAILKRATIPATVICGAANQRHTYYKENIEGAIDSTHYYANGGPPGTWEAGWKPRYRLPDGKANPHEYEPDHTKSPAVDARLDRIPGCETTVNGRKWLAFPLMMWKSYDGGRPGPDRVIASATRSASGAYENIHYCLSTYHAGNYYAPCT